MNDEQLAFFRGRLATQAQDLRDRLNAHQQDVEIERHPDEADFASDEEERAVAVKMIERDRVSLGQVSHALELIRVGDYGFCRETGEPIGLQRLLLVPESVYCVESMRVIEAKPQRESRPAQQPMPHSSPDDFPDDDIPFMDPYRFSWRLV